MGVFVQDDVARKSLRGTREEIDIQGWSSKAGVGESQAEGWASDPPVSGSFLSSTMRRAGHSGESSRSRGPRAVQTMVQEGKEILQMGSFEWGEEKGVRA